MSLASGSRGLIRGTPHVVLLYGVEGVGKTTFGASAPRPRLLPVEPGSDHVDIERFLPPESWEEILEAVEVLLREDHDYKTFIVDTLDAAEALCHRYVCKKQSKSSIEDFGYGKGFIAALDEWRLLAARLRELADKRRMNIILLAHAQIRPFKNPEGDDFDRYTLKMHEKAAGLWREWASTVLFARPEVRTVEDGGRARGVATGRRVMHTVRTAAYDAKNRLGLPETLPLSWRALEAAAREGEELRAKLFDALRAVPPERADRARAWLEEQQWTREAMADVITGIGGST